MIVGPHFAQSPPLVGQALEEVGVDLEPLYREITFKIDGGKTARSAGIFCRRGLAQPGGALELDSSGPGSGRQPFQRDLAIHKADGSLEMIKR